jgi:hypothetical protein
VRVDPPLGRRREELVRAAVARARVYEEITGQNELSEP